MTERVTISSEPITLADVGNPEDKELKDLTDGHIHLYKIMKDLISKACKDIAANKSAYTEDSYDSR